MQHQSISFHLFLVLLMLRNDWYSLIKLSPVYRSTNAGPHPGTVSEGTTNLDQHKSESRTQMEDQRIQQHALALHQWTELSSPSLGASAVRPTYLGGGFLPFKIVPISCIDVTIYVASWKLQVRHHDYRALDAKV